MINILFISHDASRTGAPLLLLNLANVLKIKDCEYRISFLINRPPFHILGQFRDFLLTVATNQRSSGILAMATSRLGRVFGVSQYNERNVREALKGIDIVISNTITNGDILPVVRKYFEGPIITYVHELAIASKYFTTPSELKRTFEISNGFLAPCFSVRKFLAGQWNIAEPNTSILHYYIPESNGKFGRHKTDGKFVVGAVGTIDWRKSPDLFIQVAHRVFQRMPAANIVFTWKGASPGIHLDRLLSDISKLKLDGKVLFELAGDLMEQFYHSIDLLILTSREDPYPLVVLEAAAASVPCICFREAGGAPEFIEASLGGRVVDYLDVNGMAEQVMFYYESDEQRTSAGLNANSYLGKTHRNAEYIANQFRNIVAPYLSKKQ